MGSLEKILAPFLFVIRNHKKTMLISLLSALTFAVIIFPYDDLSDVFLEAVSKYSQNKVFLQFDNLGIAFFPPSVEMSNVEVEFGNLPTLTAARLNVAPSVASYLAFSHGFTASADKILDGDAAMTLRAGKKVNEQSEIRKQILSLEFDDFDLKKVMEILQPSSEIGGRGNLELSTTIDPTFAEQPQAELDFQAKEFRIGSVSTPFGPYVLNLKASGIEAKAKLVESELDLQDVVIGKAGEGIYGKIRGRMGLRFEQRGNQVVPVPSNYNFTVDLNLDKQNDSNAGLSLILNVLGANQYKTVTGSGVRYAFKISGANMFEPPKTGPATIGL